MRAFCILREFLRAGVRAPAIFRGRHSSSSDEYGEWDEENKPYCPLHVYVIPVKSSSEYYQNNGSLILPEDGDRLPVLFRVTDENLSGGGNWFVGDPGEYWTKPTEVYFVQEYRTNWRDEVKLEFGDNVLEKLSITGGRSAPSNGVVYNPGYVYPRVKVREPRIFPGICPPAYNWALRLQVLAREASSGSNVLDTIIVPLIRDDDSKVGQYVLYYAPCFDNPLNGGGIIHSQIVIEGDENGEITPGRQFTDKHWTGQSFVEHVHTISEENVHLCVDLEDPQSRNPDYARVDGADRPESNRFIYSNGTETGYQRGYALSTETAPANTRVDCRWSTTTIGGFETIKADIVRMQDGLPPGQLPADSSVPPAFAIGQSNADFLCITSHGGSMNRFRGHQYPQSTSDPLYYGSMISLLEHRLVEQEQVFDLYLPDWFMKCLYENELNVAKSTGRVPEVPDDETYSSLGAAEFTDFFYRANIKYNSGEDNTRWILFNACYVLNHWPATGYRAGTETADIPGLDNVYAINHIRYWRKLCAEVNDPALVRGNLEGILGWYGLNHGKYSRPLLTKYSQNLGDSLKQYDSSLWVNPSGTPDRELALWLQAGVALLKEKPGGWTKDEYDKFGYRLAALDRNGNYHFIPDLDTSDTSSDYDPVFYNRTGRFKFTDVRIHTHYWSTIGPDNDELTSAWVVN